jgi:hypothetical protein
MKDFDEPGSLAPTGLHIGGTKYMVIQGEPGAVIRGKKVRHYFSFLMLGSHSPWDNSVIDIIFSFILAVI